MLKRLIPIAPIVLLAAPAQADVALDRARCMPTSEVQNRDYEKEARARIAACERLIESATLSKRELARAWNHRGIGHYYLKQYKTAIVMATKAISIDPTYVRPWRSRGIYRVELKQYRRGLVNIDEAIKLDPKLARAHANRCYVLQKLKRYEEALRSCIHWAKLTPSAGSFDGVAEAYRLVGKPGIGFRWIRRAFALNARQTNHPDGDQLRYLYLTRGRLHAAMGRRAAAISDLRQSIRVSKNPMTTKEAREELKKLGAKG